MKALKFIINNTYREEMDTQELYETVRIHWNMKRVPGEWKDATYAIAVAHGIIRGAYRITEWHPVEERWEFIGHVADDIWDRCVGKQHKNKAGNQAPVLWVDLDDIMSGDSESFASNVKREHVKLAIKHIVRYDKRDERGIFYLNHPAKTLAVSHKGKKVAVNDTMRVAYCFAKNEIPSDEDGNFTKKQLELIDITMCTKLQLDATKRTGWTSHMASKRLERLDFKVYRLDESESEDTMEKESKELRLLRQFYQIIFHGPPGTGKTHAAKKLVRELLGAESAQGKRWNIVQFHPSYNYEDFVRGVKVDTKDGDVFYETVDRTFGEMCKTAAADSDNDYALIIDEINRANVSAVLGELIYALEYRGEAVKTPYLGDITIPKNLFVIGTMNTADRTIGQIDYAVRRRFAFVACPPKVVVIEDETAREFFLRVDNIFNEHISPDFDAADVRVGHSYFLAKNDGELSNKIVYQVIPILREYIKDGVLTKEAEPEIKKIEDDAEELSTDNSEDSSSNDDVDSHKGKQYFYWRNGERMGVGGVGRAALSIIKDCIEQHPNMNAEEIGAEFASLDLGQHKRVQLKSAIPRDELQGENAQYFGNAPDSISLSGGAVVCVSNQWGASGNSLSQWNAFKKRMHEYDYSIGQCHLVNIGENDGDEPRARSWDDCHKHNFVSGRGIGYKAAAESLKKGDFVFVRIAGAQEGRSGYIACGEVVEEAVHISEFRTAEDTPLADCDVGDGKTYRQKYPNAFKVDYPDYAVRVKWHKVKLRDEAVSITHPPRKFRVAKIDRSDFQTLRTEFGLPGFDK